MDGTQAQINLITVEEEELKITCNKYSTARTGIEQSADLGRNF